MLEYWTPTGSMRCSSCWVWSWRWAMILSCCGHASAAVYVKNSSFIEVLNRISRRNQYTYLSFTTSPSTCITSNYQKCHRLVKLSCRADINSNVSRDAMTYQIDIGIIYRFRGIVETGYGRGGKKLEFPTANLGPSTFYVF